MHVWSTKKEINIWCCEQCDAYVDRRKDESSEQKSELSPCCLFIHLFLQDLSLRSEVPLRNVFPPNTEKLTRPAHTVQTGPQFMQCFGVHKLNAFKLFCYSRRLNCDLYFKASTEITSIVPKGKRLGWSLLESPQTKIGERDPIAILTPPETDAGKHTKTWRGRHFPWS